jgi:hypothetical protein
MTGHSGSHTPQSMHSSGWMTSMFPLPLGAVLATLRQRQHVGAGL